jgi:hypothetical protein
MATFVESFLYPLILLLIGAGITSILIPWFAKRSENRKKELEIKVDITSKMAEIIGSACFPVIFLTFRKKSISTSAEKEAAVDAVKKLSADAYKIQIMLASYSSETNIRVKWWDYVTALIAFQLASILYSYKDLSADEKRELEEYLNHIKKYFSDNNMIDFSDDNKIKWERLTADMPFDSGLWGEVIRKIGGDRGAQIIMDFLESRIKIF